MCVYVGGGGGVGGGGIEGRWGMSRSVSGYQSNL